MNGDGWTQPQSLKEFFNIGVFEFALGALLFRDAREGDVRLLPGGMSETSNRRRGENGFEINVVISESPKDSRSRTP